MIRSVGFVVPLFNHMQMSNFLFSWEESANAECSSQFTKVTRVIHKTKDD